MIKHIVDNKDHLKLITTDYVGEYKWNEEEFVGWDTCSLNNTLNNDWYANTLNGTAKNYIMDNAKWNIGGSFTESENSKEAYNVEINKSWGGKIGLPSPSDFGYSFGIKFITSSLFSILKKLSTFSSWFL